MGRDAVILGALTVAASATNGHPRLGPPPAAEARGVQRATVLAFIVIRPAANTRFDRFMIGLYCALLFDLFACDAFAVASGAPMK